MSACIATLATRIREYQMWSSATIAEAKFSLKYVQSLRRKETKRVCSYEFNDCLPEPKTVPRKHPGCMSEYLSRTRLSPSALLGPSPSKHAA